MASSWIPEAQCDLPPEVLGLVIARLPNPADRARFRAVCRSWHSSARQYARPQMPWVVLGDGYVFSPSSGRYHRLPSFPDDGICIGSTDGWLALGLGDTYTCGHARKHRLHSFLLHNTFSGESVPLTVQDSIVVHETCKIRKFLMRSTPDDFIAVVTDNVSYPLIVFQQGSGAWLPEPGKTRYRYIIDVAFLGDTLYAITRNEDLVPLDLALDGDGTPVVTVGKRVIKQSPGYDGWNSWSTSDDEEEDETDDEEVKDEEEDSSDEATTTDEEEEGDDYEVTTTDVDDDDDDDGASEEGDSSHILSSSVQYASDDETGGFIVTSRHLIESRGKLLLVRRHKQTPLSSPSFTRRVDVLEADVDTGMWVPLPVDNGLGGDRALFISLDFSKFVSAPRGEVDADVVYNIDTGEAFDFRSQTSIGSRFCKPSQGITWLFPPELVL
ncbi:unnamed protein product [Alopecurus aequalis]